MPPLHVSALHGIAKVHDDQAPAGKARLVSFVGTVVRILRRLDCDWDQDDIPHDHRLWHVHPASLRLFQRYNLQPSSGQYPDFCMVVWIADEETSTRSRSQLASSSSSSSRDNVKRSDSYDGSRLHSSSSGAQGGRDTIAAGIKRRVEEIVVIDSSDEDGDDINTQEHPHQQQQQQQQHQTMRPRKRQKQQPEAATSRVMGKSVAMILPWYEQVDPEQGEAIRPGIRIEINRAVLHVGPQRELLACVFNSRTTLDIPMAQDLQPPNNNSNPRSHNGHHPAHSLFQRLVAGRLQGSAFDALQYYDGEHRYADPRLAAKVAAAMAVVKEIKLADTQTSTFHVHYLSDLYNTLASCPAMTKSWPPSANPSSFSPQTSAPLYTARLSSATAPAAKAIDASAHLHLSLLSVQRVHRFLCQVTSLKTVHLRSICGACGQAYKVDRCEFGCAPTEKWHVCARASFVVSDGTGSALVHLDREADVWTLLHLGSLQQIDQASEVSEGRREGKGGRGQGVVDTMDKARLLRMLVRVGELTYTAPPEFKRGAFGAAGALASSSASASASRAPRQYLHLRPEQPHYDLSERGRTEQEFWTGVCERASSCQARLVLYARIKDLSPKPHGATLASRHGPTSSLGRMYKGRFWLGGQPITTVFQSRLTLECLTLDLLTESYQGRYSSSRKAAVVESRMLLNKLLVKSEQ